MAKVINTAVAESNNQYIDTIKTSQADVMIEDNTATFIFDGDVTVAVNVEADIKANDRNEHKYLARYTDYEYEIHNIKVVSVNVEDEHGNESYPILDAELLANLIVDWIDECGDEQQIYIDLSSVHEDRHEALQERMYPYASRGLCVKDFI